MTPRSLTHRIDRAPSTPHTIVHVMLAGLLAVLFLFEPATGSHSIAAAQSGAFTPECSPSIFHKARISWTTTEHYLAAPDAPAEVTAAVTNVIEQVYRPNGMLDYTALARLVTPAYREMTGLNCDGVSTPPAATPSAEASPVVKSGQMRLEDVRQADATTVSAFVVLPGQAFGPKPGSTPGSGASMNLAGTPDASTVVYDAVSLVVFVQRDGQWMIDYLSGATVIFSDVVPNDERLRKSGATFTVDATALRDHGMPAFPPDSTLVASPEASPAG